MPLSRITGNSFNATANTNIDNGLLFLNPTTNRVGIGTNVPTANLSLTSTGNTSSDGIRLTFGSEARPHNIYSELATGRDLLIAPYRAATIRAGTGTTEGEVRLQSYESTIFSTGSSYTERLRIDQNGYTLVSTTSPQYTSTLPGSLVVASIQRNYTVRANQNGSNWVNFWQIDTTRASFVAYIDIAGTENGSFNVYYARWTLAYGASGGGATIAGPFNAAQLGNDYAKPDLRVSGGWVQIKSSNNLSGSAINGFVTLFTTA